MLTSMFCQTIWRVQWLQLRQLRTAGPTLTERTSSGNPWHSLELGD